MIDVIGNKSLEEGNPSRLPSFSEETKKSLIGSADFLALNYYTSRLILPKTTTTFDEPSFEDDIGLDFFVNETWPRGKSQWLYSVPQGLYDLLNYIKLKYNNPRLIISENGFSDNGELNDEDRINYLKAHLASVSKAINDGCKITSYVVWSIIDSFEWINGYTEKFGIFSVNMSSETKERTAKKSAFFFKELISKKMFFL